jgi:hypothetical protein
MPTLTKPPVSGRTGATEQTRRKGRSGVALAMAAMALAASVAGVALILARDHHPTYTHVLIATAHPGASVGDLLALEGDIAGSDAVADPASGRLPDVRAFHRVGISAMRIENGTLSVEFLAGATPGQRTSVRTALSRSPSIASVREVRRKL